MKIKSLGYNPTNKMEQNNEPKIQKPPIFNGRITLATEFIEDIPLLKGMGIVVENSLFKYGCPGIVKEENLTKGKIYFTFWENLNKKAKDTFDCLIYAFKKEKVNLRLTFEE